MMNRLIVICGRIGAGVILLIPLTGCVTVSEYSFSFDYGTGEVRREYRNLTSRQGPNENDYSVTNDWARLRELVSDPKPEFDPEVVADVSKELFQDKKILAGRKIQRVKGPKCFPSKAAALAYLHAKEWRWELVNGEILLFLPEGKKIISTNGRPLTSAKNSIIAWPQETNRFEYVVSEPWSGGESLLPFFLAGRKNEEPQHE